MTLEQLIENYSPTGDLISVITCFVLMFIISKALYFSKDQKFIYLNTALCFILTGSGSNVVFWSLIENFGNDTAVLFVLRDIYHLSFMLCLYCFALYMKKMLDINGGSVSLGIYLTRGLFLLCTVLDILSPVTGFGFHRRNNLWYDPIVSPYNFYYAYTILVFLIMLLFYSKRIIKYVRTCLISVQVMIFIVMTWQLCMNTNSYSSYTYLLPVLVVMILLHSKPFDDKTGSLSASSFDSYISQKKKQNISVSYVALKLYINMVEQLPDELGKVLNSFWHASFKDAMLFDMDNYLFVLAVPETEKNGNIQEKFKSLIENDFPAYYSQYNFPYKSVQLNSMDFIEKSGDILGILKYLLQITDDNSFLNVDDEIKTRLQSYKIITSNLSDIVLQGDLYDPRVLTYCQPIRNMKTGKFDTAESLMRLSLPELGLVMPSMFIEIAEQYDHIHTLSKIMLNKVCRQIKELESNGYRFKRISVNFTASEIKDDRFCDEVLEIIRNHGINPSKIGIELTESQTERDFQIVKEKIKILRNAGIKLYLDDVGTGYSNLDRIVQYDVDVVKFDRFFLLEAEKSMKVIKMMRHLSSAFRDLDYKLLYEGVESEAHEALCLNCGADYIQGFKYSKPVPIEELKNFFDHSDDNAENTVIENEARNSTPSSEKDFTYSEIRNQYDILIVMSKLFYSMHIIDLVENTAIPYNPSENDLVVNVVNSAMGADEMMFQIMKMCTAEESSELALEFSDLSTISERLKGKKVIESPQILGKSIGWFVAAFYSIETDESGNLRKVLFTTRKTDKTSGII